jgi:hypothetical protein
MASSALKLYAHTVLQTMANRALHGGRFGQMPGSWSGRSTSLTKGVGLLTLDGETTGTVKVIV